MKRKPLKKSSGFNIGLILFSMLFAFPAISQDAEDILWTSSWSHDDRYIAVGGADKILRIYDGQSFELLTIDTLDDWIHRLNWHPSKNKLAIAAMGDGSRIIDLTSNTTIMLDGLKGAGTRAVSWNKDGSQLAIADYEGFIHIWKENGTMIRSFQKENTKSYTAIDWHASEDKLLVTGEKVREYDIHGNLQKNFFHRPDRVLLLSVAWHPSGEFYAIGDYGNPDVSIPPLLQFYSKIHQLLLESEISKSEYRNISWNPDGSKLATASDILRIWSSEGQLLFQGPDDNDNLWGLDWNSDGSLIVSSSEKGHIKIWNDQAEMVKVIR